VKEKKYSSAWMELVRRVLEERSFFSVRKNSDGELSLVKEVSSQAVMDKFFENAWERPILKDRVKPPSHPTLK
jgi:hypothetical protein